MGRKKASPKGKSASKPAPKAEKPQRQPRVINLAWLQEELSDLATKINRSYVDPDEAEAAVVTYALLGQG